MRLLMLTPQLPFPARQGTAIRNWGLLRGLAHEHEVHLLSFGAGEPDPALKAVCRSVQVIAPPRRTRLDRLTGLLQAAPDLAQRLASAAFASHLRDLVRRGGFNGIQVEGLELAGYLPIALAAGLPAVYDAHNAEYLIQSRAAASDSRHPARWPAAAYSHLQIPRLRRFESEVCRAAAAVTCVSTEDAQALQTLTSDVHPVVVPNGLDLTAYASTPRSARADHVVFTGKLDYRPNLDACMWLLDEIWPRIRTARPAATLALVGQAPPDHLRARHGADGVSVTGAVDDVRPHLAEASVYVAPLRMGGGTRFKLLEAMALERPIVSTTLGAEGFAVADGRELLLADQAPAFAAACVRLLDDSGLRAQLSDRARTFVSAYDWTHLWPALLAVWHRLGLRP
jgi:glycosyltransferase involved in cell wall biosynthesis